MRLRSETLVSGRNCSKCLVLLVQFPGKEWIIMARNAIIETGGKQYKIKEGDTIFVELLSSDDGETIIFDKVLAVFDNKGTKIGTPYIEGAIVEASVIKSGKSKKVIVYKMKRRKGYRRKQGHRQPYTKVKIDKI